MISELANPKQKKKQVDLEANSSFDFNQYLIRLEEILREYQDRIINSIRIEGSKSFRELVACLQPIEIARTFIAMLYLGMSDMLDIEQREVDDIKMILKNK